MGPQVGHLAAGKVPEPAEMVQGAVLLVRLLGGGTKPHVVVNLGRRIFDGSLAETGINIAVGGDPDGMDLPKLAAFDDFLGLRNTFAMAPLRSHNHDAV